MSPGDDDLERALRALREEYLGAAPQRITELWVALAKVQNGEPAAVAALGTLAHRLAGSAGSYGFQAVSQAARELDQLCRAGVTDEQRRRLKDLVQAIADAFANASAPE